MSYANIKPEYYRMFQPDSPWHAGAPGWKNAPWPGWGENPNLVGPPRLAVEGLGDSGSGSSGLAMAFVIGAFGVGIWWLLREPRREDLSAADIRRIKADSDRNAKAYTDQWKRDHPGLAKKHSK